MSDPDATVTTIVDRRVLAIVRCREADEALRLCRALAAGGIDVVEFSLTSPAMLAAVARARSEQPELTVGAGTVLDAAAAGAAIDAGATYLVTPTVVPEVIAAARRRGAAVICGGYTPTELHHAHACGADLVKLFPAATGGPGHLRAVLAPLPMLRVVPVGGVGVDNAADFLAAGAVAVAIGGELAAEGRSAEEVTARARELLDALPD